MTGEAVFRAWDIIRMLPAWRKTLRDKGFFSMLSSRDFGAGKTYDLYALRMASEVQYRILKSQEGKNLLAKKKTLEKLDKLGYLDEKRKRKIPVYCKKVAILTAETGAAYQDILKIAVVERYGGNTIANAFIKGFGLKKFSDSLPLQIAGLMSNEDVYDVADKLGILHNMVKALGCQVEAPFMTMAFMALLVIPSIKISDKGLFDGDNFEFMDVIIK